MSTTSNLEETLRIDFEKGKRVAVITGAGVSTEVGFRTTEVRKKLQTWS